MWEYLKHSLGPVGLWKFLNVICCDFADLGGYVLRVHHRRGGGHEGVVEILPNVCSHSIMPVECVSHDIVSGYCSSCF